MKKKEERIKIYVQSQKNTGQLNKNLKLEY